MGYLDKIVFGNKKLSDILEEIYGNSKTKEKQISTLITELRPLVRDIGDATLIVPLIKEYLEIGVKNDEQLIKLAAIIQRVIQTPEEDGWFTITDEEKAELLDQIEKLDKKDKDGTK